MRAPGNPAGAGTVPASSTNAADFKYACSLSLPGKAGERVNSEVLINPHFDFIVRRITWDFATQNNTVPKVRVTWRDTRRGYLDRKALITAVFGLPGEDFPFTAGLRLARGETISFEADTLDDSTGAIDIVLHGVELRPQSEA